MKRFALCIALLAACVLAQGPAAAIDIYGRFTGIDGESIAKGHEKWIDVSSYSWGAANSGSLGAGGGGGAGKVSFADFSFTKNFDKATPAMFLNLANGKVMDQALFDVVTAGAKPETFLQYKFDDVLLTSYSVSGASGGAVPSESWSFAFGRIEMTYREQRNDGSFGAPISVFWDVKRNEGGVSPVPEPSTWAMLLAGLAFVAYRGRKFARARAA